MLSLACHVATGIRSLGKTESDSGRESQGPGMMQGAGTGGRRPRAQMYPARSPRSRARASSKEKATGMRELTATLLGNNNDNNTNKHEKQDPSER